MTEADLAPWVTPAIVVALIAWLRLDVGRLINRVEANLSQRIDDVNTNLSQRIDDMGSRMDRMEQRMQGLDDRLRAVEVSVGTVYGRLDIIERYIMHRGEPTIEPPRVAAE